MGEEPGAELVAERLRMAFVGEATLFVSTINWGEVVYITECERGLAPAQQVLQAIEQLPLTLLYSALFENRSFQTAETPVLKSTAV